MADIVNKQQKLVDDLILSIWNAEDPETVTNEMVATVLDFLNRSYKKFLTENPSMQIEKAEREAADRALQLAIDTLQLAICTASKQAEEASKVAHDCNTSLDTLMNGNVSDAIESFNEIINFLDGLKDDQSLALILAQLDKQISEFDGVYTSAEIENLPAGTYYDTDEKIFVAKGADGSIAEAAIGDLEGSTIYKCGDRLYHFNDRKLVRYVDEADEVFSDIGMRLGGIKYFAGIVPTIDDVPTDDPAAVYYVRAMKEFRKANDLSGANVLNVYNDKNPAQARKDIFFCCTADGKFYTYNETAGDLKELHGDAINSLRNGIILAGNAAKAAQSTADQAAVDIELLRDAIAEADYASKDEVADVVSNAIAAQNRAIGTQMREVNSAINGVAKDLLETKTDLGDRLGVAEMDISNLTGELASLKEGSGCAVMPFFTTTKGLQGGTTPSAEKGESGNVVLNLSSGLFLLQSGSKFYADFEGSEQYGTVTSEGVRPVAGKLYVNRRGGEIYYLKGSALVTVANSADIAELQEAINVLVPREKGSTFRLTGTMPDGYTEADCVFNGEPFEVDAEGRFDLIDPKYAPESYEGLYLGRFKTIDYISADPEKFTSAKQMFAASKNKGGVNLKRVNLSGLDTRNVTDFTGMFSGNTMLEELDVREFDTSNAVTFSAMFGNCSLLTVLDVSGFDTSKATNMASMFASCSSLRELDVRGFDMSGVTTPQAMFSGCGRLRELDVSGWDMGAATTLSGMFNNCRGLVYLDLRGWDVSNVTYIGSLVKNCESLRGINLRGWNTENVNNMVGTFWGCEQLEELDLSGWDTCAVTKMNDIFRACGRLKRLNLHGWDMSAIERPNLESQMTTWKCLEELDMSGVNLESVDDLCTFFSILTRLERFNMRDMLLGVSDTDQLFSDCARLKMVDLRGVRSTYDDLDTNHTFEYTVCQSSLEDVYVDSLAWLEYSDFLGCNALIHVGSELYRVVEDGMNVEGNKLTRYVTERDISETANKIDSLPIVCDTWINLCQLMPFAPGKMYFATDTGDVFVGEQRLYPSGPSKFRLTGTMNDGYTKASCKFNGYDFDVDENGRFDLNDPKYAPESYANLYLGNKFKSIEYISADTEKFTSAANMFTANPWQSATLKRINLDYLDTSNVKDASMMFWACQSLQALDVSKLKMPKCTDMTNIFGYLKVPELDLSDFDTSSVKNMTGMLAALTAPLNLSNLDTSNAEDLQGMFCEYAYPHIDLSSFNTSNVKSVHQLFYACPHIQTIVLPPFTSGKVQDFWLMGQNGC